MVRQDIHQVRLNELLRSPSGGVARDLLKRGYKVQAKAKILISGAGPGHPKRVRTGLTRSSIQVQLRAVPSLAVRIGTNVWYARMIHNGTGIYGPRRHPIYPKRAKVLRWKGSTGKVIFAKSVKGMKKNQFLKDALSAAG
jgi:hypothetical protein